MSEQEILEAVRSAPRESLPMLLAEVFTRLLTPPEPPAQKAADELIGIDQAAKMLGLTRSFLYHSHSKFPFTRRVGRKLLFSTAGIQKFIQQQGR